MSDEDYPALADGVMAGISPGSAAGGEQPKFTAFNGQQASHVIVKVSPRENHDAVDAEFTGIGTNWPQAANALFKKNDERISDKFKAYLQKENPANLLN